MFRQENKQRSRSFTDASTAHRWANLVRFAGPDAALEELRGEASLDVASRATFDDFARAYIDSRSGVEEKTVEDYEMFLRTGISAAFGARGIAHITDSHLAAWGNSEIGSRSSKSIRNRFGFISAVFNYAVAKRAMPNNPCPGIRLPRRQRKEPVFLMPAEFAHILRYLPEPERDVAMLLVSTGLRWGELSALTASDIDLGRRTVTVSKAWKHSSTSGWYLGPPKSSRSNRTVPFSDELLPMLRRRTVGGDELLFTNRRGGPLRQQRFLEGYWKPALRMANGLPAQDGAKTKPGERWSARTGSWWDQEPAETPLNKKPRVHDLRHTHASWLIADGVGLTVVQRRLGHESIKATVDTYGHLSEEHQRTAADSMSKTIQVVHEALST